MGVSLTFTQTSGFYCAAEQRTWNLLHLTTQRRALPMTTAITLKDITIHLVVEQQGPLFDALEFSRRSPKRSLRRTAPGSSRYSSILPTGRLVLCVQGFVIKMQHQNILVDTCVGNHKPRPARPFWNTMRSDRYGPNSLTSGTQSRCAISQIRETPIVQRSFAPLSLTNAKDSGSNFPRTSWKTSGLPAKRSDLMSFDPSHQIRHPSPGTAPTPPSPLPALLGPLPVTAFACRS